MYNFDVERLVKKQYGVIITKNHLSNVILVTIITPSLAFVFLAWCLGLRAPVSVTRSQLYMELTFW